MNIIGSVGLLVVLNLTLISDPAAQRGRSPGDTLSPYAGSQKFCDEHVVGAPQQNGKAGPQINWTGYYSTDPLEKVVGHYLNVLGSANHQKEGNEDIWRFPLTSPERVLTVTDPRGTFPRGQCSPPPASARAIIVISMITRP